MSSTQTNWILNLIDKVSGPMKTVTTSTDNATKSQKSLFDKLGTTALRANQLSQSIQSLSDGLTNLTTPGIQFQSALADVEAITGVTGKALEELGDKARANALQFGGDAAKSVETYKLLLSQLGPELASTPEILDKMASSVSVLSKTMDGDTTQAATVLTTAMNQYGISLDDPKKAMEEMDRMMNSMAASAKEGSSELPTLQQAVEKVGGQAKASGLSFEEMLASIQILDKAGKKGAEGGTAMTSMLKNLGRGRFVPDELKKSFSNLGVSVDALADPTVKFSDKLRMMKPVLDKDAAAFNAFFGEFGPAAAALVRQSNEQDKLTGKITGTTTATDQAEIVMGTFSEKMGRINAAFSDFGIKVFNATEGFLPFIKGGSQAIVTLIQLAPAFSLAATMGKKFAEVTRLSGRLRLLSMGLKNAGTAALSMGKSLALSGLNALKASASFIVMALQGLGSFIVSMGTAIAAQWGLNVAMSANPIGLIIIAIAAVVAAIVGMIYYWDEIKAAIWSFIEWQLKNNPFAWLINLIDYIFPGAKQAIFDFFSSIWEWIKKNFIEPLEKAWEWLKDAFGFGDETTVTVEKVDKTADAKTHDELAKLEEEAKIKIATDEAVNGNNLGDKAANSVMNSNLNGGSGGGAGKTITMNIDIKQTFNVAGNVKQNIEDIANETIKIINDKLRDGLALA